MTIHFIDEDDGNNSIEASEPQGEGAVDVDGVDDRFGNVVDSIDSEDGRYYHFVEICKILE